MSYDTVKELHIGIDLGLQRLNSNFKQAIKPEEKDWVLTETMYQIIKDTIDPNPKIAGDFFEIDITSIEKLESLKVDDFNIYPVFKTIGDDAYVLRPKDFYLPVKVKAVILETALPSPALDRNVTIYSLAFTEANLVDNGSKITLNKDGATIFNGSSITVRNNDSKFLFISNMLSVLNDIDGISAYWTKYSNYYKHDSFIIVVDKLATAPNINISITIDEANTVAASIKTFNYSSNTTVGLISKTRIVNGTDEDKINDHEFEKSHKNSLVITSVSNLTKVKVPKGYSLLGLYYEYIKKPRMISSVRNIPCEVTSDEFKLDLVNKTVQKLSARIQDNAYQAIITENSLLE